VPPDLLASESYDVTRFAAHLLATASASLLLGILVAVRERASREARLFLILTFFIALWLSIFSIMYCARTPELALWWGKLAYLGIPALAPTVYHFTVVVTRRYGRRRRLVQVGWALAAAFSAILVGTDLMITGVHRYPWGYYVAYGWTSVPYVGFFVGFLALSLREYVLEYRQARPGRQRDRIRWLAIAFALGYLALVDYLPAYGVAVYPFGYLAIFLFLLLSGWAIGRYRLVDLTPSFAADRIVTTMVDPLLVCDTDGRIRFANPATSTTLGYARRELLGQPLDALIAGRGSSETIGLFLGGPLRHRDVVFAARDGQHVDTSVYTSPLHDQDGTPVGVVVIARDIREWKRVERELEETERRFQLLVDAVVDYAMCMLDPEGRIASWNQGADRIFGYTAEEALGRPSSIFFLDRDVERGKPREELRIAAIEGRFEETEWRVRKDGEKLWANVVVSSVRDADGRVIGFAHVTRDLTRQRQLEDQLRQSQKMEAIGRLAGGIAHDFNNLLTVIGGHTQLLLQRTPEPHELRDHLDRIESASKRAARLIRQLLTFSRKQVVQPQVVDLNDVIAELEQMLRRLIGEDVEFVTDLAPSLGGVNVDRGQIEQVIMNLVVNARDAMPQGGRLTLSTGNVELDEEFTRRHTELESGEHVLLSVMDTGIGMDEKTLAHIFEPFFTTKGKEKGTGLGLSTAYGIMTQSGGAITARSRPGRGTNFTLYLPRADGRAPVRESDGEPTELPRGTETILVVEDDPDVLDFIGGTLHRCGYTVLEANSPDEAVALARAHGDRIRLLLTDVILPRISGIELADDLRCRQPGLKVVFMTGYADRAFGADQIVEPEIHLLQKPLDPQTIAVKLREVLDGGRHQRHEAAHSS
jgi:PAS domain S-box-containing protein